MKFYENAPVWDSAKCPKTCPDAKVVKKRAVSGVTVLKVSKATYRNALVSGAFVIANDQSIRLDSQGEVKVRVYALWFGHRLLKSMPELTFDAMNAKIVTNYTGEIVSNIALK